MYSPLIEELAHRGHNLTLISNYAFVKYHKMDNVRQIVLEELAIDMSKYPNTFKALLSPYGFLTMLGVWAKALLVMPPIVAQTTYQNSAIRSLIVDGERFDLVMVSQSAITISLPIAWHYQVNKNNAILSPKKLKAIILEISIN